jgi:hypothetical protein
MPATEMRPADDLNGDHTETGSERSITYELSLERPEQMESGGRLRQIHIRVLEQQLEVATDDVRARILLATGNPGSKGRRYPTPRNCDYFAPE